MTTTRDQMLWRALALHDSACGVRRPVGERTACTCGTQVVFRCPFCGYLAAQVEIEYAFMDFDCPRCRLATLGEFEPEVFRRASG